jgi:hypothetical protein
MFRLKQSVSKFYSAVALDLMGLVSQQWQLELAWARLLRERIVAAQASGKTEAPLNE